MKKILTILGLGLTIISLCFAQELNQPINNGFHSSNGVPNCANINSRDIIKVPTGKNIKPANNETNPN